MSDLTEAASTPTRRHAARVIVVDAEERVLLLHAVDPGRAGHAYWFTTGGGLEPGETCAQGAARELYEETGLRIVAEQLGEPVWREVVEFAFGGRWYRQDQEYFLLRVDAWEVVAVGLSSVETRSIDGHRWWSLAELRATDERYYPAGLPDLLERILKSC